jgi:hypothetical protein
MHHAKLLMQAAEASFSSSTTVKIGVLLKHKNKIILANNQSRTVFGGSATSFTGHAEQIAICKAYYGDNIKLPKNIHRVVRNENIRNENVRRGRNKSIIYIARVHIDENGDFHLMNTQPCSICINWLEIYGIDKVCYSVVGGYVIESLAALKNRKPFISSGTKFILNNYVDR